MMKKRLFFIAVAAIMLCLQGAYAQKRVRHFGVFDHLSVGVSAGTPGFGFELAAPVTDYLALRAGYQFMPEFSYKTDVDYTNKGVIQQTEVEGKLKMGSFNALLDIYPSASSSFHFTGGFYYGKSDEIITAENTTPVLGVDGGLEIGDYIVGFDSRGFAKATIEVARFRPYAGIGFGRAVPRKRLAFSYDMGVQFWGSPKVYEHQTGTKQQLTKDNTGTDAGKVLKYLSKVTIYPVINFRLTGRIF